MLTKQINNVIILILSSAVQLNRLTGGGCETGSKTDVVFCTPRVRCGGPPMSATGKGD